MVKKERIAYPLFVFFLFSKVEKSSDAVARKVEGLKYKVDQFWAILWMVVL